MGAVRVLSVVFGPDLRKFAISHEEKQFFHATIFCKKSVLKDMLNLDQSFPFLTMFWAFKYKEI